MVTDNNGRTHEPAGTPHGGRFARRNGFGSDSDLDDFTRTRTYADLDHYWNDEDYMLEAQETDGLWESIDRDQAVDEQGTPYYERYAFSAPDDAYRQPDRTFSAEQMKRYADIW